MERGAEEDECFYLGDGGCDGVAGGICKGGGLWLAFCFHSGGGVCVALEGGQAMSDRTDRSDGPVMRGVDLNAMLREHEPFLRFKVEPWKSKLPTIDVDDLMQEARLAMVHAAGVFDASRGVKFITFAGRWVDHCVRRWVQRYGHLVRGPRERWWETLYHVRLDAPMDGDEEMTMHAVISMPVDAEAEWAAEDDHVRLMAGFETALTPRERAVLWGVLVEGRTQREIAPEWRVSHTMIQQVLAKGIKKLRGWMERPAVCLLYTSDAADDAPRV